MLESALFSLNVTQTIFLKHFKYGMENFHELKSLLCQLRKTTSKVDGIEFNRFYFLKGKEKFSLVTECINDEKYLDWRAVCPPTPGTKEWHEVRLLEDENFSKV
jgi:hypothetical protein